MLPTLICLSSSFFNHLPTFLYLTPFPSFFLTFLFFSLLIFPSFLPLSPFFSLFLSLPSFTSPFIFSLVFHISFLSLPLPLTAFSTLLFFPAFSYSLPHNEKTQAIKMNMNLIGFFFFSLDNDEMLEVNIYFFRQGCSGI